VLSSNLRVAMAGASGPDSGAPSTRVNQWQKSFTGLKVEAGLSSVAGSAVSNAGGAGAVQILGGVGYLLWASRQVSAWLLLVQLCRLQQMQLLHDLRIPHISIKSAARPDEYSV
jgi:hypothetical protein